MGSNGSKILWPANEFGSLGGNALRILGAAGGKYRPTFDRVLWPVFVVFLVVSTVSYFDHGLKGLDLFVHYRPQLAIAAMLFIVAGFALRRYWIGTLATVAALAHVVPVLPYLLPSANATVCHDWHPPLRFVTINLHYGNADMNRFSAWLEVERPDVIALTEVVPDQAALFHGLAEIFPYQIGPTGESSTDVLVLSRVPITASNVYYMSANAAHLPVLEARLCPEGRPCITVVTLHAERPMGPGRPYHGPHLELAARIATSQPDQRLVLLGDLNMTPWSPAFRELLAKADLRDTAKHGPFRSTWLTRNPLFGLPIDHVLVGKAVNVHRRRVGPDIGSDHYPVTVHLSVCAGPVV